MNKLFSIVIPTLNRCEYLKRTLDCLLPQVEQHLDEVELIVCCNASKDETDAYMRQQSKDYPFIKYKYFDEYVEVGQSLIRSVGEAQGKFVVLWGDDDIPMPFFVTTILDIIKKNPDVGIIHCNRLAGKDLKYGMKDIYVEEKNFDENEEGVYSMRDFVPRFGVRLGFISSCVFNREGWLAGIPYYNDQYYGYEHLSIIVNGNKESKCFYYPYPLEIQRLPYKRDFSEKWPLYRFVGVPNMLSDFDENGVTDRALFRWHQMMNSSLPDFIWNMMYCTQNRVFFKSKCSLLNRYQKSKFRKFLTYLIVYFCPGFIFKTLKSKLYK